MKKPTRISSSYETEQNETRFSPGNLSAEKTNPAPHSSAGFVFKVWQSLLEFSHQEIVKGYVGRCHVCATPYKEGNTTGGIRCI